MATLLLVFVPQYCADTGTTCSFQQNFTDLSIENTVVLIINFLCLGLFLGLYYSEGKRQFYLIHNFDIDKSLPDNYLKGYLSKGSDDNSKTLYKELVKLNNDHLVMLRVTSVVYIINVILSCWICALYYDGYRTVTGLVTNVLLVISKLNDDHSIISTCVNSDVITLSTTLSEPVSYNALDKKTYNNNDTNTTIDDELSKEVNLENKIKYSINDNNQENVKREIVPIDN